MAVVSGAAAAGQIRSAQQENDLGQLVNGRWQDTWYDTRISGGRFVRSRQDFRNWITPDGRPGPSGEGGFAAESGRYHLYVSLACPWALRVLIFRSLKGLEAHIGVSVVHPDMLAEGWTFAEDFGGATGDGLFGLACLRELYLKAAPATSGRVTVPVLWDKAQGTIVSNESAEIIRMLNSAFDGLTGNTDDYWPEALLDEIEAVNARVYEHVSNCDYRAGFATSQTAYDGAVTALFEALDWLEARLAGQRYLVGDRVTEANWRLFTTLVRFDAVCRGHFKCNLRRLVDYPNLWAHARELYQRPEVAPTVRPDHFIRHYYCSHDTINPHRIVPVGPALDWNAPHGRGSLRKVGWGTLPRRSIRLRIEPIVPVGGVAPPPPRYFATKEGARAGGSILPRFSQRSWGELRSGRLETGAGGAMVSPCNSCFCSSSVRPRDSLPHGR